MAKEMKEATSRIIGRKKRKKRMITRIGVTLIIVRRTSRPNNKRSNKDGSPHARKGKLARQITRIP